MLFVFCFETEGLDMPHGTGKNKERLFQIVEQALFYFGWPSFRVWLVGEEVGN